MAFGELLPPVIAKLMGDISDFQAKMMTAQGEMTSTESKGSAAFTKLAGVGKAALLGMGAAAIGISAISIKMAGDFQEGLTTLVTGAGESEKNLKKIHDGILDLSVSTATSTKQLIDGMFMIESAGYHGAAGLKVLQAAAQGAKVGNADLGVVANAVTTVMNDYHLSANQATDATNFLVGVVKQGKTHMEDLASALAQILPIASSLNVPLADVGGALATLTGHGIDASKAATYLRFAIGSMVAPSKIAMGALDSIGLKATDLGTALTTKGLTGAMNMLEAHLKEKFPEGGAAMFATLSQVMGGVRGLGAALGLSGDNLDEFLNKTLNTAKAIDLGHGAVIGWEKVQKDWNFQVAKGEEMVKKWLVQLGEKLIPVVTSAIKWLTQHKTVVEGLAIAIGSVLVLAIGAYIATMIHAAYVTALATAPIWVVIAAIGLLVGTAVLFATKWDEIWNWIKNNPALAAVGLVVLSAAAPFIVFGAIIGAFAAHWQEIWDWIKTAAENVAGSLTDTWHDLEGILGDIMDIVHGVGQAFTDGWGAVKGAVEDAWNFIRPIIKAMLSAIHSVSNAIGSIGGFVGDIAGGIGSVFGLAEGGTLTSSGFVDVGENGRERLFLPQGASVVPLDYGGGGSGGGGMQVNVVVNGGLTDRKTVDYLIEQIRTKIRVSGSQGLN